MKNSKYSQILDSLIGDQIPQDLNLAPKIHTKIQKQKGAVMNRRKKVLVPTAVVLMMLTVVTFTVPAVADTIQRWIGYIPGFGQVHDDKLRTLAEPQNQTVNGVTLSVDEVVASSDKTLVKYSIFGIEDSMKTSRVSLPGANSIPINSSPCNESFRWKQVKGYWAWGFFPATEYTNLKPLIQHPFRRQRTK